MAATLVQTLMKLFHDVQVRKRGVVDIQNISWKNNVLNNHVNSWKSSTPTIYTSIPNSKGRP